MFSGVSIYIDLIMWVLEIVLEALVPRTASVLLYVCPLSGQGYQPV